MTLPIERKKLVLAATASLVAAVEAGVREEGGNNRGEQIRHYQESVGGEPGDSWCLQVQEFYELKKLADLLKKPYTPETIVAVNRSLWPVYRQYMPVTGSCGTLRDGLRGRYLDAERKQPMLLRPEQVDVIYPGNLILFAWKTEDIKARIPRHVGRAKVLWRRGGGKIASLEGNTPALGGNQSDGDGIYCKPRSFGNVVAVIRNYIP